MKPHGVRQKDILFLAISMFVVVVAWIGSNLYHTWVTTTISDVLQMQIVPISPKFDTATIEKLKDREKVDPLYEVKLVSPTPSESSTPAPVEITPEVSEISPTPTPSPTEEVSDIIIEEPLLD